MNDDLVRRTRPKRDADGPGGNREQARNQRTTCDSNRKQERRDRSLHPFHYVTVPA
jgi:hypothetical protein